MQVLFGLAPYGPNRGHVVNPALAYGDRAGRNAAIEPVSRLSRL